LRGRLGAVGFVFLEVAQGSEEASGRRGLVFPGGGRLGVGGEQGAVGGFEAILGQGFEVEVHADRRESGQLAFDRPDQLARRVPRLGVLIGQVRGLAWLEILILSAVTQTQAERLTFFALINLVIIESLTNGLMSGAEAVNDFYFANNCLFVRKSFKDKIADRVMSHGLQLPDLLDALPIEDAQREFLHELAIMRALCLQLLEGRRKVA